MLQISLLGRPEILLDGNPVTEFRTNKAQALLCYLAATGISHSRHALAGLLWSDDSEENAKNSLRVVLNNLNKLLPDHLDIARQSVTFRRDSEHWLDIAEFEKYTEALNSTDISTEMLLDPDDLRQAVALYRGSFLEDLIVEGALSFDEWLIAERTRWRQEALKAMETLANALLAQHQYDDASKILKQLLILEPWHEEAHRHLMVTLSRIGDIDGALAQYEICRQRLADELDVEPMPETTALFERIQVARTSQFNTLPKSSKVFVGRTQELGRIHELLTNPDCRLLTLVGLGGIGKSSLALEAAQRMNQSGQRLFLNGVLLVSLTSLETVEAVILAIADMLNVSFAGQDDLSVQLVNFLQNKEILLVLDNFEHLLEEPVEWGEFDSGYLEQMTATDLVTDILEGAPEVKILVTSREPLQLGAEWRLDLDGLAFPDVEHVASMNNHALSDFDALQLFLQNAQLADPMFQITAENRAAVSRICQLVAGIPLGIELAAAWVQFISCNEIVQEIQQGLDFLTASLSDVPERQQSMRAVFRYSWQLLSHEEREIFRKLGWFRIRFTLLIHR